ncbi:PepSY-associated TM helix domain-containing protein [Flavihumibacter fluvii]|uniref:PepSY-associated TM helix domain-containing protein n=1 Tax=Flavihumibacter fluvii TaxID=2838157 RepID=UPI001BDF3E9B|nr:PepSY-associated TM helix domain-containing protein [Flavihumibacter fluvii]ULQ51190.1 PepSY domain-containing protein [Flavihumibacter fluvii]
MKVFFRRIHLYLGLAAGLVIMVTCFTGAVLVFEPELQMLFHKERYIVAVSGIQKPLKDLQSSLKVRVPGVKINGVKWYNDRARSVEFSYALPEKSNPGDNKKGKKGEGGAGGRKTAFINPYTAEVIALYNYQDSFFFSMMSLHRWLLKGDTGKLIVGMATLVFLVILVTGIILWWPKTRNIMRQRLTLKWDAGWKRVNHDLHLVLGFYSAIFLFVFAFTGLAWSFEWFNKGIYTVTNSSMQGAKPPVIAIKAGTDQVGPDEVLATVKAADPSAVVYSINQPKDSTAPFSVNVLRNNATHESATDNYFVDRYSASLAGVVRWEDRNLGQRVRATFKPVHIASIFGLPSKIIGFIVCLLGTTFPITGVIMWLNRTWKKNKKPVSV